MEELRCVSRWHDFINSTSHTCVFILNTSLLIFSRFGLGLYMIWQGSEPFLLLENFVCELEHILSFIYMLEVGLGQEQCRKSYGWQCWEEKFWQHLLSLESNIDEIRQKRCSFMYSLIRILHCPLQTQDK